MIVSPAKMAEPIEILFGLWTRVGPRNDVLDGVQIPMQTSNFEGIKGWPIVKYRDSVLSAVQKWLNRLRCHLGCGHWWLQGSMC